MARLFTIEFYTHAVSSSSTQGIVQSNEISTLLRKNYRVEAVLNRSSHEWYVIWRRRRWFWQKKD